MCASAHRAQVCAFCCIHVRQPGSHAETGRAARARLSRPRMAEHTRVASRDSRFGDERILRTLDFMRISRAEARPCSQSMLPQESVRVESEAWQPGKQS